VPQDLAFGMIEAGKLIGALEAKSAAAGLSCWWALSGC